MHVYLQEGKGGTRRLRAEHCSVKFLGAPGIHNPKLGAKAHCPMHGEIRPKVGIHQSQHPEQGAA